MSDNIVKFKKRKFEDVWECECGCQIFYLTASMKCECKECHQIQNGLYVTHKEPDEEKQ